jgi:CheY-like chemotaxis protein
MIGFLARDLTTWKKAEQVLAQARDSALQAVEMKSHFVANMSHELRTPLVAVIGAADLMKTTDLNAEQEDLLESITISSNTLLHLVNDLLDFSKMELGVMAVENSPFDLPAAVMEIKNKFDPEATKKQLQLNTVIDSSLPNIVGGDGQKIRQILHNLVSNAIKFTHQGEVTVQTTLMEDDSSTVMIRFAVKDTGVGISKEMLPLLFSVFTQGDTSLTRKFGGTGIGLAMCKHLVKLMGGDIGVTSNVGTGSEFWAALPFRKISAVVKTEHSAEIILSTTPITSPSKHQHTLLLVEDNPMNQKIIKACLEKIGIRSLHVVDNGAEAVQTVTQQQYDLILMDCQMPVMDGYVATAEIRRHETTNSITRTPIIALTAHGLPQDREKCIHAGMDDYICKPLKLNELKSILAKYLPL